MHPAYPSPRHVPTQTPPKKIPPSQTFNKKPPLFCSTCASLRRRLRTCKNEAPKAASSCKNLISRIFVQLKSISFHSFPIPLNPVSRLVAQRLYSTVPLIPVSLSHQLHIPNRPNPKSRTFLLSSLFPCLHKKQSRVHAKTCNSTLTPSFANN